MKKGAILYSRAEHFSRRSSDKGNEYLAERNGTARNDTKLQKYDQNITFPVAL